MDTEKNNTSEEIICDLCKRPVESRKELTVAMAFSRVLRPFHTDCYRTSSSAPVSNSGFWKYGFVVNRGLWPLISAYAFYALVILFILVFLIAQASTVNYYPSDWVPGITLLNTLLLLIVFVPAYLLWKRLIKRKKDICWELYESKLPECLNGTGQIPCDICKRPILARNDLLIMITWKYSYVPIHPRCLIEAMKSPKARYMKIHHRVRWEKYHAQIPLILFTAVAILLWLIWRNSSGYPAPIIPTVTLVILYLFFYQNYRGFRHEAELSWKEYESKLPG